MGGRPRAFSSIEESIQRKKLSDRDTYLLLVITFAFIASQTLMASDWQSAHQYISKKWM
jgi:hypothetical protein